MSIKGATVEATANRPLTPVTVTESSTKEWLRSIGVETTAPTDKPFAQMLAQVAHLLTRLQDKSTRLTLPTRNRLAHYQTTGYEHTEPMIDDQDEFDQLAANLRDLATRDTPLSHEEATSLGQKAYQLAPSLAESGYVLTNAYRLAEVHDILIGFLNDKKCRSLAIGLHRELQTTLEHIDHPGLEPLHRKLTKTADDPLDKLGGSYKTVDPPASIIDFYSDLTPNELGLRPPATEPTNTLPYRRSILP